MPAVKSKVKPEVKPATKPAVKPVAKSATKSAVKPAAKSAAKPVVKPAVKAEAKPKSPGRKTTALSLTPQERYQMIAEAAYFHAEKRGFALGDTAQDWLEAEAEIDRMLQAPRSKSKASPITAKQAFQEKLETQIQDWDAKLADLRAKTQETTAEIRADYEKQFEMLTEKRNAAQAKMQELRSRAGDVWEDLKGGTEKAWDEMQKALDQIAKRFK